MVLLHAFLCWREGLFAQEQSASQREFILATPPGVSPVSTKKIRELLIPGSAAYAFQPNSFARFKIGHTPRKFPAPKGF